jgi:hypothetical protein
MVEMLNSSFQFALAVESGTQLFHLCLQQDVNTIGLSSPAEFQSS